MNKYREITRITHKKSDKKVFSCIFLVTLELKTISDFCLMKFFTGNLNFNYYSIS